MKSFLSLRQVLKEVQREKQVQKEQRHVPMKRIYFFMVFQMQFSIQKNLKPT